MKTFTTARVLVVIAIALFSWLLLGPVMAILLQQMTETIPESFKSQGEYVFIHIPYIFLFLAILLGSRLILKCSLGSFLSGSCGHFRWNLFLKTGLVYILFMAAATPFASKGLYASGVNILQYLLSAIPVLILTPIQTLSEEVLFRVLPLRLVTKEKMPGTVIESLPLVVISGILFALPHIGNREVAEAETAILPILCYFLWGAGAMFISIASDGFETAIAMHTANNLFIALFVNYEGSSMPIKALFTAPQAGSVPTLIETVLVFGIISFYLWKTGFYRPLFMPGKGK